MWYRGVSSGMERCRSDRRRFLGSALAVSTTVGCSKKAADLLSESEMTTLAAICDQMIPPDQDPGGAWAGVHDYISRQVRGPFREHIENYRRGIAEANRLAGGSFASLSRARQLDVLNAMDRDKSTKGFIALVATHSVQGYFGNPRHGGNRDYCGWRMLGVPPSPVRGRDPYDFSKGGRS
jgi:gluconate 2-dehydrogenase gamma chain